MHAYVVYTEVNYIQIMVVAESIDAAATSNSANTTNTFYYTYSNSETVPEIIPKTYYEAICYLDGRRKFQEAMGLNADSPEDMPVNTLQPPKA